LVKAGLFGEGLKRGGAGWMTVPPLIKEQRPVRIE
jgi:hypothetical protein